MLILSPTLCFIGKSTAATSTQFRSRTVSAKKPPLGAKQSGEPVVRTSFSRGKTTTKAAPMVAGVPMEGGERQIEGESSKLPGPVEKSAFQNLTYTMSQKLDESNSQSESSPAQGVTYLMPAEGIHTPSNLSMATPLKSASDIQVSSEPRPTRGDVTYIVEDRPSSARKQWNNKQPQVGNWNYGSWASI